MPYSIFDSFPNLNGYKTVRVMLYILRFCIHTDSHYSKTCSLSCFSVSEFCIHTDSHYSKTDGATLDQLMCFVSIRIHITPKLVFWFVWLDDCFVSIKNCITPKRMCLTLQILYHVSTLSASIILRYFKVFTNAPDRIRTCMS